MGTRVAIFCSILIIGLQKTQAQVNLTSGLIAYYPFSGNTNDFSGNNHHATNVGGGYATADRFGNSNSAWYLDGIDDYLRVADNGAFSTPSMSMAFWFKTEALQTQVLVGKRAWTSQNNSEFGITLYPSSLFVRSFMVGNNRNCDDPVVSSTSQSIQANYQQANCHTGWHHVAVTFSNGVHKLYLDGQLLSSAPANFNSRSICNTELRFGVWWSNDPNWFKGAIDEIRWYNRPLTDQEVEALFESYSPTDGQKPDFTFSQNACDPKAVNLTPNSSSLTNMSWSFGDGNTSNMVSPTHTYSSSGNYLIKLKSQNSLGCFDSVEKVVSIGSSPDGGLVNNSDTTICAGASIVLRGKTSTRDLCWQPLGLSSLDDTVITITPVRDTSYQFVTRVLGHNLVANGDFSQGNSGFTSDYSFSTTNTTAGQYFVGSNPNGWNTNMSTCNSQTGAGNMLMVNGSSSPGAKVWLQTVPVTPNTNYQFSFWHQSLHSSNPAQLKFSINNVVLGHTINALSTQCQWTNFQTMWNSGNQTSATIAIINFNTATDGNDFALDAISFSTVEMRHDSVRISVSVPPDVLAGIDTDVCANLPIQLSATGANFYSWSPTTGLSDPSIANPIAIISDTVAYVVTGWDTNGGCTKKDTIVLNAISSSALAVSPPVSEVCEGTTISLLASGGHVYDWFTSTRANLSNSNQYSFSANASESIYVAISDTVCHYRDTLESVVKVRPMPVVSLSKSNDINCTLASAQLSASGGDTYKWQPNSYINSTSTSTVVVNPTTDTWYKVRVSREGCSADDSVLVKVDFDDGRSKLHIPTAFTPNKDGKNDLFRPALNGPVKRYELNIYNRWGELIFQTKDPLKGWDGTLKGKELPTGVYIYWLRTDGICSTETFTKGTIVLIR